METSLFPFRYDAFESYINYSNVNNNPAKTTYTTNPTIEPKYIIVTVISWWG